jgi:hypothetical protein
MTYILGEVERAKVTYILGQREYIPCLDDYSNFTSKLNSYHRCACTETIRAGNIIGSTSSCMLYKGTLSSGVEIAVASSLVTSAKDWSKESESQFRRKVVSSSYLQFV